MRDRPATFEDFHQDVRGEPTPLGRVGSGFFLSIGMFSSMVALQC